MSVEAWTTAFVVIIFALYIYIGWRSLLEVEMVARLRSP